LIDPGVSLGYVRHGLRPHPLQVAVGRAIRRRIVRAVNEASDVVISHFHGDHIPLVDANPYQLAMRDLPHRCRSLRCWSKSADDLSPDMRKRWADLSTCFGDGIVVAEGLTDATLSFSPAVPHGSPKSALGSVMMTRIESGAQVFVHASDIQLLDDATVDRIIDWRPTTLLAAGPPLYLGRLGTAERECAWRSALRLVEHVRVVILDHHLMRDFSGPDWLDELSKTTGKRVYCAADFMGRPRRLLESRRAQLYTDLPVATGWHARYALGEASIEAYFEARQEGGTGSPRS
jgi:predicted metallo-beta-lactamase superfamily hydrolase